MSEPQNEIKAAGGGSDSTAMLGVEQTHGFTVKGADGKASREVSVALFSDDSYRISFKTTWEGKDEPVVTRIAMTASGFSLFSEAIMEASLNMQTWPTPLAPNAR